MSLISRGGGKGWRRWRRSVWRWGENIGDGGVETARQLDCVRPPATVSSLQWQTRAFWQTGDRTERHEATEAGGRLAAVCWQIKRDWEWGGGVGGEQMNGGIKPHIVFFFFLAGGEERADRRQEDKSGPQ